MWGTEVLVQEVKRIHATWQYAEQAVTDKRGDSFFPICPFLATLIMYKWDLCIKKGSIKRQQNIGQVLCFPYIGEAYLLRQETLLLPIPICLKLKTLLSRKIQETMLQKNVANRWHEILKLKTNYSYE